MFQWFRGAPEVKTEREIRAESEIKEHARRMSKEKGVDISFLIKYIEDNEVLKAHNLTPPSQFHIPSYYDGKYRTLKFNTHVIRVKHYEDGYGYTETTTTITVSRRELDPQMDLFDAKKATDTLKFVGQLDSKEVKQSQLKTLLALVEAKYNAYVTEKADADLRRRLSAIKEDLNSVY